MELETMYEVAEKHFFAKSYSDVKLDNIANELGIKKPSLYYYFVNKRDFFIKTLKYSMKKYLEKLNIITKNNNLRAFIYRYLVYPSQEHNLFAIAAQKGVCSDKEINYIIHSGKETISREITEFLKGFELSRIKIYLLCNLMEKLAMDNCIDGYCLDYSLDDLTTEIEQLIVRT